MEAYVDLVIATPAAELKQTTEGHCWDYLIKNKIPTNPSAADPFYCNLVGKFNSYVQSLVLADPSIPHNRITHLLRKFGSLSDHLIRSLYYIKYADYRYIWSDYNRLTNNVLCIYLEAMVRDNEFEFDLLWQATAWKTSKIDFANIVVNQLFGIQNWEKATYKFPTGTNIQTPAAQQICDKMSTEQILSSFREQLISIRHFAVRFMITKRVLLEEFKEKIPPLYCNIMCGLKDKVVESDYVAWNETLGVDPAPLLYIWTFDEEPPEWMCTADLMPRIVRECLAHHVTPPTSPRGKTVFACEHNEAEVFYSDSHEIKCKDCWQSIEGLTKVFNIRCPVCLDSAPSKVFILPCHHTLCRSCSNTCNIDKCPICMTPI